ncbi:DUF6880 family protein [Syntrophotalea acetylenica]|uniref:DUF6880 family protein n=1 Tax=Syntrophotalea acetylenica TaxID=29542 RepID=UPI002A3646BD|nr:DUF6880 family protein [Syntrophotalea acetylenica]MDY0261892.1 hypothetical protein [Syntrophotalea acetylenica]
MTVEHDLKSRFAALKRSRRFVRWGESAVLARELRELLQQIENQVEDAKSGCTLVADFYTSDRSIFDRCDDSSGHVGDIYRYDACELFVSYAKRCADKSWLAKLILKTSLKDDYGVRDVLVKSDVDFLPEAQLRWLIDQCQQLAEEEKEEFQRRHWFYQVESLARQLKDAPLFEQTRHAAWGDDPGIAACVDIARVYLECGEEQTALDWLERIPAGESFHQQERDELLLAIYGRQGDKQRQAEVARRSFHRQRSRSGFERWISIVGDDQRTDLLNQEVRIILDAPRLSLTDAAFLAAMEQWDAAESYLQARAEQLDGDHYQFLLPLAETFESLARPLTASLLYLALLDSILRRARTTTYGHGVRYLHKLDLLAQTVNDWRDIEPHTVYVEQLRRQHGRKTSFWSRYER